MNLEVSKFQEEVKSLFGQETKRISKPSNKKIKTSQPEVKTQYVEKRIIETSSFVKNLCLLSVVLNIIAIPYALEGFKFIGTTEYSVYKLRRLAQEMTAEEKKKYLELSDRYNGKLDKKIREKMSQYR